MEQEISGLKVCRQLLLLWTLIQIRPQVVIFTGLLQRCKQWGYQTVHGTNPVTYDLPIPFEEAPFTVAISTGNSGNHASCGGFTKTTIVLRAGTTAGVWDTVGFFIIGCQLQWGKILGDTVNLKIINFPVSFNECFGGLALFNGDPVAAAEYATITDITNTNFKIYMYANNAGTGYANANIFYLFLGAQPQWGYYTAAVGAIYTDVTTPVSFSRCFLAASIDILLAASTTWPGTTQTVWNINASTANKLRFIWAKAPIELDGAVWFGIFIQTVGILFITYSNISNSVSSFGTIHCSRTKNHKHVSYGNRSRIFRYYQC